MLEKILIVGSHAPTFSIASLFANSNKEVFLINGLQQSNSNSFLDWQNKNQDRFFLDANKHKVKETDLLRLPQSNDKYWVIDAEIDENLWTKSYLDFLQSGQVLHVSFQSTIRLDSLRKRLDKKALSSGMAISSGEQLLVELYQFSDSNHYQQIEEFINLLGGSVFSQKNYQFFYAYLLGAIAGICAFQAAKKYRIPLKRLNSITGNGLKISDSGVFDVFRLYPHLTQLMYHSDDFRSSIMTITGSQIGEMPETKAHYLHNQKIRDLKNIRKIDRLDLRIKKALDLPNKYGKFYKDYFHTLFGLLKSVSEQEKISFDDIDRIFIDFYGWNAGPLQLWQKIIGHKLNNRDRNELVKEPKVFSLLDMKPEHEIWRNSSCSIIDLGDGILNLEFHNKMNIMDEGVIEGMNRVLDLSEQECSGIIIGNEGDHFSVGVNLGLILMSAIEQDFEYIDYMANTFQKLLLSFKYCAVPVVVVPHHLCLGGGCELSLHATAVYPFLWTNIGLVEVKAGLIPSGGGTKELAIRAQSYLEKEHFDEFQKLFSNIAEAKLSQSAVEARSMGLFHHGEIAFRKQSMIFMAKNHLLSLSAKPLDKKGVSVAGKYGLSELEPYIQHIVNYNSLTDDETNVIRKAAYVFCGGDISFRQEVSEQYLLDLEREAFLSLCGEKTTLQKIWKIIK